MMEVLLHSCCNSFIITSFLCLPCKKEKEKNMDLLLCFKLYFGDCIKFKLSIVHSGLKLKQIKTTYHHLKTEIRIFIIILKHNIKPIALPNNQTTSLLPQITICLSLWPSCLYFRILKFYLL